MGQYIFTPPALAYTLPFRFAELSAFIRKGHSLDGWFYCRKVGTTVTVLLVGSGAEEFVRVKLYDTVIATIAQNGTVEIMCEVNDHQTLATTYWAQKTITDNGHRAVVGRQNYAYAVAGQVFA